MHIVIVCVSLHFHYQCWIILITDIYVYKKICTHALQLAMDKNPLCSCSLYKLRNLWNLGLNLIVLCVL